MAERINGTRRVEVPIDMVDHFKALSIKVGFLDEKIRNRRFDVKVNNLLPPCACDGVGRRCN